MYCKTPLVNNCSCVSPANVELTKYEASSAVCRTRQHQHQPVSICSCSFFFFLFFADFSSIFRPFRSSSFTRHIFYRFTSKAQIVSRRFGAVNGVTSRCSPLQRRKRNRVLEVRRVLGLEPALLGLLGLVHQRLDTEPPSFGSKVPCKGIGPRKRLATPPLRHAVLEKPFTFEVLHPLVEVLVPLAVVQPGKRLGTHQTLVRSLCRMCLHVQLQVIGLGKRLATSLARVLRQRLVGAYRLIVRAAPALARGRNRVAHQRVVVDACPWHLKQLVQVSSLHVSRNQARAERVRHSRPGAGGHQAWRVPAGDHGLHHGLHQDGALLLLLMLLLLMLLLLLLLESLVIWLGLGHSSQVQHNLARNRHLQRKRWRRESGFL